MQEEAEQVTRKLRKLWVKYTKAQGELDGAWGEWAGEKEEMLDSVRMLQQQLTLKDLVIQAFVPPEDVQKVLTAPPPSACCTSPPPDGDPSLGSPVLPLAAHCRACPRCFWWKVTHMIVSLSSGVLRPSVRKGDGFKQSHVRQLRNQACCVHQDTQVHVHKSERIP